MADDVQSDEVGITEGATWPGRLRVLIGSVGGLTGVYLAKQLRRWPQLSLFGSDANDDNVGRFFVDGFFPLPPAGSPDFPEKLLELLNTERIDLYVPTHSREVRKAAEMEGLISDGTSAACVTCPAETFDALENKADMLRSLGGAGIPVPVRYEPSDLGGARYPLFAKRDLGSGGSDGRVVHTVAEAETVVAAEDGISLYERLDGPEYTIDCLFDRNGALVAYNTRERLKTMGGAVVVTSNRTVPAAECWLKTIAESWLFRGCVNFQFMMRGTQPVFTDVNLRCPSGGLPLSVESGMDVPRALLQMAKGERLDPRQYRVDGARRTMYRHFEEVYS